MSEFNISDKEIKSLLQSEGLESPSEAFNESVLSKIEALEKRNTRPVTAPKWLLILVAILFIAPSLYFVLSGQSILTEPDQFSIQSLNPGISSQFFLIGAGALLVAGITLLFTAIIRKPGPGRQVKKG